MPTNAEIKALIDTRVRAQRSHILHDGVAEILDFMVDNIAAGGGGETPGIDSVLAVGQALTADRTVDLAGNRISFQNGQVGISLFGDLSPTRPIQIQNGLVDTDLFHIDITPNSEHSVIKALNTTNVDINTAYFEAQTTENYVNFEIQSNFGGSAKLATIQGHADATESWLEHTADTHIFNGTVQGVGIDDVLAEGQVLTVDRSIGLNGFGLNINGGTKASGNAGNINIVAPGSTGVNEAGNVIITGGLKADGAGNGGDVIITSGGATENDPGSIFIIGASATEQGKGGVINLTGGNAVGESETGGDVNLTGGNGGAAGQGGNLMLTAGNPGVGGASGNITVVAASANETNDGGMVQFQSGLGGSTSGNGGGFQIVAGNAQGGDGNGGSIVFNAGEKNGSGLFGKFTVNYISGGDPETMLDIDPNTQSIVFPFLAGGGTTGLSIDNDGKIIRTP